MGKRRLAYMVRRFHDGIYVLLTVEGGGGLVHELERRLRVTEPVIKFITVRVDEEQKRLDKIKAIRDARNARLPPAPPARRAAAKRQRLRRKGRCSSLKADIPARQCRSTTRRRRNRRYRLNDRMPRSMHD